MRRAWVSLVCLTAVGCGTDTMPQLFNEAAQSRAEFVDRMMLIVDESTADVHFKRGKTQFEDRLKDIKERFDKLKNSLSLDAFDSAVGRAMQKKEPFKAAAALASGFGKDNWVEGMMIAREAMVAQAQYTEQEFYTKIRWQRELARLQSLQLAIGTAPKIGEATAYMSADKVEKIELFKFVGPELLFFSKKTNPVMFMTPQDYAKITLPPPPQYLPVGGGGGAKKTASLPEALIPETRDRAAAKGPS